MPEWGGKSEALKIYRRRVTIYIENSRTHPARRGGKLLERLKGDAIDKTENLSPRLLRCDEGVDVLLEWLKSKHEPLEAIRVGTLIDKFLDELTRRRGEEVMDFNTRFESSIEELESSIGATNPFLVAHRVLQED